MKKVFALVLAAAMLLCAVATAEVRIGQVDYAAHGTKCFAVLTAVVDGETIVAAHIDEFQLMPADSAAGAPNSETIFADLAASGQVLGSKRVNNGYYSTNMVNKAGATKPLGVNYDTIEAYVTGKTISELEAEIEGKDSAAMLDVVTGCTLADTLGYVTGLVEAAKAAAVATGYYTLYNVTGEKVTEVSLTNVRTGEVKAFEMDPDAVQVVTMDGAADDVLVLSFVTESGYTAAFETLHIETTALTLLAADALTGATPISFFAPAK